jgi:glucokinase
MLAQLAGGTGTVTGRTVSEAASRGDLAARQLLDRLGYWLGLGIATLVNLLDVEVVVIGGGLVMNGNLLLAPARASFQHFVFGRDHRMVPPIMPAHFGPGAGMIGAASLALDQCREQEPATNSVSSHVSA